MERKIKDRYKIIEPLDKGGFSETFLAEDTDWLNRPCVIKQLAFSQDNSEFDCIQSKFQQEAKVLYDLGEELDQNSDLRPRIPRMYAYFSENNQFYLVQEWIQGETLTKRLKTKGLMNEEEVKQLLVEILPVLQFIHDRNIVHRDIKPGNLMIRDSDGKPVLIDFGIVKKLVQVATDPSTLFFTPYFGAPEQERGEQIHHNTDLYGLGITAIYALTGKHPKHWISYLSKKPQWYQISDNISNEFRIILNKAIQPNPRDRYSTAQEMLEAIQSLMPVLPVVEPISDTRKDPGRGFTSRTSRFRFIALSLSGAIVAIGSGFFYFNHQNIQDNLMVVRDAHERGDHSTCIAEAKRFTQSHVLSHFNSVTEAERLGNECSAALKLQNHLRNDVPKLLREQRQPEIASLIEHIEPFVKVIGEEVYVTYTASPKTAPDAESIRWLTAIFISALRGTPDKFYPTQYENFSQLIVATKENGVKATVTTKQWNDYLEKYLNATESQRDYVKQQFLNRIYVSSQ
jgi:serine/threonine protein kinase